MRCAFLSLLLSSFVLAKYSDPGGNDDLFLLQLEEGELPFANQIAFANGFRLVRRLHSFPDVFIARKTSRRRKRSLEQIVEELARRPQISWAEPVTSFVREKRRIFSRGQPLPLIDTNLTGKGVVVAILDDGVDYSHPALSTSFRPDLSFNFVDDSSDPMPEDVPDSNHGTHCAGVVSMSLGTCGAGVAPNALLAALKMLGSSETINDVVEGDALAYRHNEIDVYSVSWGPRDDGRAAEGPRRLARMALEKGATEGRGGKGSLYVWASGNGGLEGDDCAMDGYASNRHTLTFGVTAETGRPEWYAEGCPAVIAAVPSSSAVRWTTEVGGGCSLFSGSSAAAPYAAGVLAQLLEANPHLSQRDVQHLIVRTSRSSDLVKADPELWVKNGAGYNVSRYFGFGTIDPQALFSSAKNWKPTPPEKSSSVHIKLPQQKTFKPSSPLRMKISFEASISSAERVELNLSLSHPRRGDVVVTLTSPSGTKTILLTARRNDDSQEGLKDWRFVSVQNWGEDPKGEWVLRVEDTGRSRGGTVEEVVLTVHGV